MATISNISGISHPELTGQVRQTTGPRPATSDPSPSSGVSESQNFTSIPTPFEAQLAEQKSFTRPDQEQVQDLANQLQQALDAAASEAHSVSFRLDPRTKDFVIEIHDPEGELVKQFPPEKILNLRQRLAELSGMVLDKKS